MPLEANKGRARVTLGQKGLTQSLEADVVVYVGILELGAVGVFIRGFIPNICLRQRGTTAEIILC